MSWALLLPVAVVLVGVAAAGVLHPVRKRHTVSIEGEPDPLHDERRRLLRALRELDEERAAGGIADETYGALRAETEARAVSVLRALEARDGDGDLPSDLREVRAAPEPREAPGNGGGIGRPRRVLSPLLVAAVVLAVAVPLLSAALRDRPPGEPITGDVPGGADAVTFFERRVREHPDDLAARLDLAERYLATGEVEGAIEQYREALRIDPRSAEAHAQLGLVLYGAGEPRAALRAVDRALEIDGDYPLALYYRGVILLRGLDRGEAAADALRAYLRAAPYGAFRDDARRLLERAETRMR